MTLASYVTLSRVVLIVPIIFLINNSEVFWALALFILAGLTDYLDGFIARKTKTETSLGALLDLLADKLLVCLVLLWCANFIYSYPVMIAAYVIIARELIISSMRQFLVEKIGENPIKVTYVAKSKTTIQMIAISFLILNPEMGYYFSLISILFIWIAAFISIYSLFNYFKTYKHHF
tara:strand:+ start:5184 stop:5714 length:531 start_codon:yes stop_codon:yes gene_type:complete